MVKIYKVATYLVTIMFVVLDLLTTVIGLSLGASEQNLILVSFLQQFSYVGYVFMLVFHSFFYLSLFILLNFCHTIYYKY